LTFESMIQSFSFPALDHKGGTWNFEFPAPPSSPPHLYIKKEGNQVSQLPLGNFSKSGDLLLDNRRDLDLWQKQQNWPNYRRQLLLLWAVAFLGNVLEALKMVQTRCSVDSPEAHPGGRRSATVANNIMLKVQVRAAKSRQHSAVAPSSRPIRQVCGLLPVLIDSIRFLLHALCLWILLLQAWVIVDLLFPIARDCSKSTYLWFVEICRWNC
jgi:hypothetical protein